MNDVASMSLQQVLSKEMQREVREEPIAVGIQILFSISHFMFLIKGCILLHQSCCWLVEIKYDSNKNSALSVFFFLSKSTIFTGNKVLLVLLFLR